MGNGLPSKVKPFANGLRSDRIFSSPLVLYSSIEKKGWLVPLESRPIRTPIEPFQSNAGVVSDASRVDKIHGSMGAFRLARVMRVERVGPPHPNIAKAMIQANDAKRSFPITSPF